MVTTRRRRRAQGMVEFALIAPLFLLMLFGLFDLGAAVYTYNTLSHGTEMAAAYASLHCGYNGNAYNNAQLNQQVLQAGQLLQAGALSVTATPSSGTTCSLTGTSITVTSTYRYHPITPMFQAFFPQNGLPLQASVEVLSQ